MTSIDNPIDTAADLSVDVSAVPHDKLFEGCGLIAEADALESLKDLQQTSKRLVKEFESVVVATYVADRAAIEKGLDWTPHGETARSARTGFGEALDSTSSSIAKAQRLADDAAQVYLPMVISEAPEDAISELKTWLEQDRNFKLLADFPTPQLLEGFTPIDRSLAAMMRDIRSSLAKSRSPSESEINRLNARIARLQTHKKEQDDDIENLNKELSQTRTATPSVLGLLFIYWSTISKESQLDEAVRKSLVLGTQIKETVDERDTLVNIPHALKWEELLTRLRQLREGIALVCSKLPAIRTPGDMVRKELERNINFLARKDAEDSAVRLKHLAELEERSKLLQSIADFLHYYFLEY